MAFGVNGAMKSGQQAGVQCIGSGQAGFRQDVSLHRGADFRTAEFAVDLQFFDVQRVHRENVVVDDLIVPGQGPS